MAASNSDGGSLTYFVRFWELLPKTKGIEPTHFVMHDARTIEGLEMLSVEIHMFFARFPDGKTEIELRV